MPICSPIWRSIRLETGLNGSADISYNKFLAKLASDHREPNGQYVITPEMGPAFVEVLPVSKFHGIGPATSTKMNALGLDTGLDMRNQSLEFMQANFRRTIWSRYCGSDSTMSAFASIMSCRLDAMANVLCKQGRARLSIE